MENKFRLLEADEIECRVGTCTESGFSILLYKDARCDMNILDETVGPMNWQRKHEKINDKEFCTVYLKNEAGEWVGKQDCGTRSNTMAEKGESSDAFKRACVNWGIGRELYTAPFIWINGAVKENKKKPGTYLPDEKVQDYIIKSIEYDDKNRISRLVIIDKVGKAKFSFGKPKSAGAPTKEPPAKKQSEITPDMLGELLVLADQANIKLEKIVEAYDLDDVYQMSKKQYANAIKTLQAKLPKDPEAELEAMLDTLDESQ